MDSNGKTYTLNPTHPRVIPGPGLPKLTPGKYSWYVSYKNASGWRTSATRHFQVTDIVSLPSAAEVLQAAVTKPHPRVLPAGATFTGIKSLIDKNELQPSYQGLVNRANEALTQPLPKLTEFAPQDIKSVAALAAINAVTHKAQDERFYIEALAYVGRFNGGDRKDDYTKAAVARLTALAQWDPIGISSEENQDQANREVYLALAEGLDLVGDQLTSVQKAAVVKAIKARVAQTVAKFGKTDTTVGMDSWPYDSHMVASTGFLVETLLYSVDAAGGSRDFPEAATWLAQAYELWIANQDIWGGADGGWGNSTTYGWFMLDSVPRQVAALKLTTGYDLARWQPIARLGDYFMAMTAPVNDLTADGAPQINGPRSPFGDGVDTLSNYSNYALDGIRMLAGLTRSPTQEWYWRVRASNITTKYPLPTAHYMLLALNESRPAATAPVQNSFVFEDAGVVALHSSTQLPERSSVYFRSSSLAAYNHSHADNNAFTFISKGKDLLISAGYYDYYGSPHHKAVTRATRFKNALTFDGGIGQAEPVTSPTAPGEPFISALQPRGRLVNYYETNASWAFATGDGALAYQGRNPDTGNWTPLLSNAVRTVAYNRTKGVLVVYDWATSAQDRNWELNFQSLNMPTLGNTDGSGNPSGRTVKVTNDGASACIDVYGLNGSITLASGFPVPPEGSPKPVDQYRAIYKAGAASKQLAAVTVIREDCKSMSVAVNFSVADGDTLPAIAVVFLDGDPKPLALYRNTVSVPQQ
ncbi:MAG TPA: DUF4962 domain-containing protein [Burkholderiaceae bacterium]